MDSINGASRPVLATSTVVSVLRTRASEQTNRRLYTFLGDDEGDATTLTCGQADAKARAIAAALQSVGAAGQRALLLYPPGLDYISGFLGCLYAGVVAVPAYPPDPLRLNRTLPRLQSMVADAQATIVLTTSAIMGMAHMLFAMAPDLADLCWIATDAIPPGNENNWRDPPLTPDSLAFLQYTSGSTGSPRGVILTHGNLLHNSHLIVQALDLTPESIGAVWLPPYHDMGLIGGILQPVCAGCHVILMSPLSFLQQPFRWLKAISDYQATVSGGPNFAYDLCVRKITSEQRATLNLSSWRVAFNGAEPVRAQTLDRFAALFAPCGFRRDAFRPCYGLAEATLIVSGGSKGQTPVYMTVEKPALERHHIVQSPAESTQTQTLVGCGTPLADTRIEIVNPSSMRRCAPDEIGEIWVANPSVAQGYWNRPAETHDTFQAYLADSGDGPFLRTGDLGFLHDGEVFITGRIKDLIIIRGRNHYPQDIELTVEKCHPALRPGCGAAFSVDIENEERLIVVYEVDTRQKPDLNEIADNIRQTVATAHDLQVYSVILIEPRSIAKTSSGKIQRHACRADYLNGKLQVLLASTLESSPPATPDAAQPHDTLLRKALLALSPQDRRQLVASHVRDKIAHLLHAAAPDIDMHLPINSLGLDSVAAVDMLSEIEDDLGVTIAMSSLANNPTIEQLAHQIADSMPAGVPEERPAAPGDIVHEYPLSHGQRALWFLHQLAPDDPTYIIARAVSVSGDVDVAALQRAFQKLIDRQPSLRTTFATRDGQPVQCVHEHMPFVLEQVDASAWRAADMDDHLLQAAYRPFDLQRGPLVRLTVFTRSGQEHIFLLAIHHIISDLWSLAMLLYELGIFLTAEITGVPVSLPPLTTQFTDHVRAEAEMLASPKGEELWDFWQKQLGDELPVLNLITDRPRPPLTAGLGAAESLLLGPDLTEKLKALAQAHNATPFMTMLAAFQVLLHRYTGQDDILVGTPRAGRTHKMLRIIGFFVNSVVMRANLRGDPTFAAFLDQTRQSVQASLDHGDFPFALLVERLQPARDLSRSPVFQAMFAWQKTTRMVDSKGLSSFALNEAGGTMPLGPLTMVSLPLKKQVSPFDLTLLMTETDSEMAASLEYKLDLFEQTTIRRMLDHFKVLLEGIVAHPDQRISQLPLLTDSEQRQVLIEWNATGAGQSETHCVHDLISAQAKRTPEAVAVVCDDQQITYADLNEQANRLAHYLQEVGVTPGTVVALYVKRGTDMITGLLGLLKAGGTYLPLDPAYPPERLAFMLQDAGVRIVLTHEHLRHSLPELAGGPQLVCLDADQAVIAARAATDPISSTSAQHPAYIIYTSGSTGQPKGVVVSHGTFANHCRDAQAHYHLQPDDRVLQFSALNFDPSLEQIVPTLMTGATLVVRGEELWNPADFRQQVRRFRLSVANIPPAYWQQLIQEWPKDNDDGETSLRLVIIGGDVVPPETIHLWQQTSLRSVRLLNAYGPTEAVITATTYDVPPTAAGTPTLFRLPIGRPLPNRTVYILDRYGNPTPVGVPGELYLGGRLAQGYLNRPELTSQKFVRNPFSGSDSLLYATGDLARYLPNGNIDFLGRIDQQIKVRGFRIEIGEIEAVLSRHAGIREVIVTAHADNQRPDEKILVAYVVPQREMSPTADDLRQFVKTYLPDYMIPSTYIMMDSFPLTASGKVDRRALPIPDLLRGTAAVAYVAPRTPVEEHIARLWAELLRVKQVGINDNFFELGGHSLLATQILSRLRAAFHVDLPVRTLFENPTVAGLSLAIAEQQIRQADSEEIAQMLAELDQLSDSDVQRMLSNQT